MLLYQDSTVQVLSFYNRHLQFPFSFILSSIMFQGIYKKSIFFSVTGPSLTRNFSQASYQHSDIHTQCASMCAGGPEAVHNRHVHAHRDVQNVLLLLLPARRMRPAGGRGAGRQVSGAGQRHLRAHGPVLSGTPPLFDCRRLIPLHTPFA